eukprot:484858-Prorocentrum_minimum.AAC.1
MDMVGSSKMFVPSASRVGWRRQGVPMKAKGSRGQLMLGGRDMPPSATAFTLGYAARDEPIAGGEAVYTQRESQLGGRDMPPSATAFTLGYAARDVPIAGGEAVYTQRESQSQEGRQYIPT